MHLRRCEPFSYAVLATVLDMSYSRKYYLITRNFFLQKIICKSIKSSKEIKWLLNSIRASATASNEFTSKFTHSDKINLH